jgi:magnesium-transporting ATPase (P-type)
VSPKVSAAEEQSREVEGRTSPSIATAKAPEVISKGGFTTDEARSRLAKSGPNPMLDTSAHPIRMALHKFCAPVPWMLEAAIVVELALGKAATLAVGGFAMTPLLAWVVTGTLVAAAAFAVLMDLVKVPVFQRLKIT